MMAAVFATMLAALLAGWYGWKRASVALVVLCLVLAVKLFLFEIYSPETGFRMPWIQTQIDLVQESRT
jgi:predicted MFS family arabinose efflux permease